MREIKFRAWDGTEMGEALYWSPKSGGRIAERFNYPRGEANSVQLLQYTGLKDKNGVEIYEGDITKWHYGGNWAVEWHTGVSRVGEIDDEWGDTIGFYISNHKTNPESGYRNYEPLTSDRIYEVIGNKYENPDLLQ